jgi:phenylacetate-CoA ligase
MNALVLSSFQITRETAPDLLEALCRFRPRFLRGYPSALCEFVTLLDRDPALRRLGLAGVSTHAENLAAPQRALLADAFGCRVHDFYSQWEQVCVIAECAHGGRHVQAEYGVLELLDGAGRPVPPGAQGEIVGTNLVNRVMPLLRYRTGDLARAAAAPCPCGRPHPVIASLDGRQEDAVETPGGRRVGRLDAAFKYTGGIDLAQVVQASSAEIEVRLVRNRRFRPRELEVLERHLRERVGDALGIRFVFVEHLPRGPGGKLRFVVRQPPRP